MHCSMCVYAAAHLFVVRSGGGVDNAPNDMIPGRSGRYNTRCVYFNRVAYVHYKNATFLQNSVPA